MAYFDCIDFVRVISQTGYIYRLHEAEESLTHRFGSNWLEIESERLECFFGRCKVVRVYEICVCLLK